MTIHPLVPVITGDPTNVTLTDNVTRTPSTTRPTFVTVVVKWDTLPAGGAVTIAVTVGATTLGTIGIFNAEPVNGRLMSKSVSFWVPANTAYKVDVSDATNATITATEAVG